MLTQLVLSFVDLCPLEGRHIAAAAFRRRPSGRHGVRRDGPEEPLPVIPAACAEWDSFQGNLCPVLSQNEAHRCAARCAALRPV